jgi:hypothetical protein
MEDSVLPLKVFAAKPAGTIQGIHILETDKNDLDQKTKAV